MKVASVQLNLKHCFSQKSFQSYIEKQVFENLLIKPDVICFPENINYCLLFAKQEKISSLNIKNNFESLFDKVISKLDLSFIFRLINIKNQEKIILQTMSNLAKKYNVPFILVSSGAVFSSNNNNMIFNENYLMGGPEYTLNLYDKQGNKIEDVLPSLIEKAIYALNSISSLNTIYGNMLTAMGNK